MRSVYKNQKQLSHTCSIACEQISLFSIWVLIGYPICCQKPIWSHMFDCKWAVCLFSLWVLISYLICCQKPNAIWLHAFDCTWSSLLVFNLSSDWLGNLFPNTCNHTCLIVPEELACFYFEFWLSIRSVFKIRTQLGQFGLIGCFWHLSSFWLAVVTTLVFWFSTLNQIPL